MLMFLNAPYLKNSYLLLGNPLSNRVHALFLNANKNTTASFSKVFLLLGLILFTTFVYGQTTYTSIADGDFDSDANWSIDGGVTGCNCNPRSQGKNQVLNNDVVVVKHTITVVNDDFYVRAGGELIVQGGTFIIDGGDVEISKNAFVKGCGEIRVDQGNFTTEGDLTFAGIYLNIIDGNLEFDDGDIIILDSAISVDDGNFTVDSGVVLNVNNTNSCLSDPSNQNDFGYVNCAKVTNFTPACSNYTLDFDGVDDYVDFGDKYDFTTDFSFEAWLKIESTSPGTRTIFSKKSSASSNSGYELALEANKFTFRWNSSSSIITSYAISDDIWHHVAVTFDTNGDVKIYVDGIEFASASSGSKPSRNNTDFLIGASSSSTPSNFYHGWLDEVRIWNVALTETQIRKMMNQEIEKVGSTVQGFELQDDINGLSWNSLEGYYPMTYPTDITGQELKGQIDTNSSDGELKNITTWQKNTSPLPYVSTRDGNWDDSSAATPWLFGDSVWNIPNGFGIDGITKIDWNIVRVSHVIDVDRDVKLFALVSESNALITDEEITDSQLNIGASGGSHELYISAYLKLDGKIDLQNESQLIQPEGSWLDEDSSGYLERDQQGRANSFTYNYWSSPVSKRSTSSNNTPFNVAEILRDGTDSASPQAINFNYAYTHADAGASNPIKISTYWIWKYINSSNDYSEWQWVGDANNLNVTEGYSMKGSSGPSSLTSEQNYTYRGKPNNVANGATELVHTTFPGNLGSDGSPFISLTGNPFPSALDADAFIDDNINNGGTDAITGTLYFWEHWSDNTHVLKNYQGGYATYTKAGGVAAIAHPDINQGGSGTEGTGKVPGQYIPVGQGFFVTQQADEDGMGGFTNPSNGSVVFKNSQRVFQIEDSNSESVFARPSQDSSSNNTKDTKNFTSNSGKQRIWLGVVNPEGFHRQLLVTFVDGATDGIDRGYEAGVIDKLPSDGNFILENKHFSIVAYGEYTQDREIPLVIVAHEEHNNGAFEIQLEKTENIDDKSELYIKDRITDQYFDIRLNNFELNLDPGTYADRFALVFKNPNLVKGEVEIKEELEENIQEEEFYEGELMVFYNKSTTSININKTVETNLIKVSMVNTLGQTLQIWSTDLTGDKLDLPLFNPSTGVYILNLEIEGSQVSKKIIIN